MKTRRKNLHVELLRLRFRIFKIWERMRKNESALDMASLVPFYREVWQDAAFRIHAEFTEIGYGIWRIAYGNKATVISSYKVQIDDPVVLDIAGNKLLCYRLLMKEGLRVPEHQAFTLHKFEMAKTFMEKVRGGLFVIKPSVGTSGARGVTTHIRSYEECIRASVLASLYSDEIIIERWIFGESYRLLVLNGEMIHATRQRGLRLIGDGKASIARLIANENERRLKCKNDGNWPTIKADRDYKATLQAQGMASGLIPEVGQMVLVKTSDDPQRRGAESRTVFNENVTDLICEDLRAQAVHAAKALNSKFAGIDIITPDPTVSLEESGGAINEINTTPGLHHHYNLINDDGTSPAVLVLQYLLEGSSNS